MEVHPTRPVAGYFRVSQARDDMKAPQYYEYEIVDHCRRRRVVLAEVFSDVDFSAFRGAKRRPALEELKKRRREFSAVIVPKLSRFGRSVKDLVELFELFESDGVALVFLDMGLDTSTSQGRLLRHILSAFAEYESDVRADYFRAARDSRARKGLPPPGWVAYGYDRRDGAFVINEQAASVVRHIFESYASGHTLKGVVRALNAKGVPSPKGIAWSVPTVRQMLDNHHYIALLDHDGEMRPGAWPALVTEDLWQAVQERRQMVPNRGVERPAAGLYLLSGLIECGHCGSTLCHRTKQDRGPGQYTCRGVENTGYCTGGAIAEHRAERLVVEAYLERYGMSLVHDPQGVGAPMPLPQFWQSANLDQRRTMLRSAIGRLVLPPRPAQNRRGKGVQRGRCIDISWAADLSATYSRLDVPPPMGEAAYRVCAGCDRRRHVANYRLDAQGPGGRTALCNKCRR